MTQAAALWKTYSQSKSTVDRGELIERYAPLTKYVVDRLNLTLPPSMSYDDLLGQAVLGLIDAIDSYDQERGVKFETYAYHRIRGSVIDMLREMDWLPRSLRRKERELASTNTELEGELGRVPTEAELAAALGLSVDELTQLNCALRLQNTQSLNEIITAGEGEFIETMDLVEDEDSPSPEAATDQREEKRLLAAAIENLPDKEKTVIGLYYQEGLTLKEIAAVLGVTESWACQLHSRAVSRLRNKLAVDYGIEETEDADTHR